MNVLLINPPAVGTEVTDYLKIVTPPMGLAYIAAVLEKAGYPVKIIDAQVERPSPSQLKARLEKEQPDIIGVTSVTPTIYTGNDDCQDRERGMS